MLATVKRRVERKQYLQKSGGRTLRQKDTSIDHSHLFHFASLLSISPLTSPLSTHSSSSSSSSCSSSFSAPASSSPFKRAYKEEEEEEEEEEDRKCM